MTDLMNKTFVANGGTTEDGKWRYEDANNLVTELENRITKPADPSHLDLLSFITDDWAKVARSWADGDLLYVKDNSGTLEWQRLGKGTDGQVLTVSSGLPSWQNLSEVGTLDLLMNNASVDTYPFNMLGYYEISATGLSQAVSTLYTSNSTTYLSPITDIGSSGAVTIDSTTFTGLPNSSDITYVPIYMKLNWTVTSANGGNHSLGIAKATLSTRRESDTASAVRDVYWETITATNADANYYELFGNKCMSSKNGSLNAKSEGVGDYWCGTNYDYRCAYNDVIYPAFVQNGNTYTTLSSATITSIKLGIATYPKSTVYHDISEDTFCGNTISGIKTIELFDSSDKIYVNGDDTLVTTGLSASKVIFKDGIYSDYGKYTAFDDITSIKFAGNPRIEFNI